MQRHEKVDHRREYLEELFLNFGKNFHGTHSYKKCGPPNPTSWVRFGISVENLLKMKDRTLADADEAFVRTIQVERDKDRCAKKKGHEDQSGQTTMIPEHAGEADSRDAGNA